MMNKFLVPFVALLTLTFTANAQSLDTFKERLAASDTNSTGRVTVSEHGDAAAKVAQAAERNQRIRFKGYRVCIFFDNSQNARARAVEAQEMFALNFPEIPISMVYENPYFKVSAGNCVTSEEAIILQGRIRDLFPKAFTVREELTVTDLIQ